MNTNGNVTFVNKFAQEFFGYTESEIIGKNVVGTVVPPTDSAGEDPKVLIRNIVHYPDIHSSSENENMRKHGERIWVAWTNKGIYDRGSNLRKILCIGNDRTAQKRAEEMLAQRAKEEATAAECNRLARDLHDAVSQTLFSASIIAEVLPRLWERNQNEGRRRLDEIRQLTRGALTEMLTIREKKGSFKGLKLAYAGDVWNVCQSLMIAGPMLGMDVYVARPEGYEPNERILNFARAKAKETGTKLVVTHDLDEAVTGADVIYANTWHSMGAKDIEKRLKDFGPYQINEAVLAKAKDDVIFMHCGPAFHGEEMTDEVIYGPHSAVWDEAENRMHTQKAVLSLLIA